MRDERCRELNRIYHSQRYRKYFSIVKPAVCLISAFSAALLKANGQTDKTKTEAKRFNYIFLKAKCQAEAESCIMNRVELQAKGKQF